MVSVVSRPELLVLRDSQWQKWGKLFWMFSEAPKAACVCPGKAAPANGNAVPRSGWHDVSSMWHSTYIRQDSCLQRLETSLIDFSQKQVH